MVKLFVLGDFHGKISSSLFNKIKKEKPDFILSPGDFCGNERLSDLIFKYFYNNSEDKIPSRIKREYNSLEESSFSSGASLIRKLKELKIPIYAIHGNWDPTPYPFDLGGEIKETKKESLRRFANKLFRLIDFSVVEEKDFILVGGAASSSSGISPMKRLKEELSESDSYGEVIGILSHFMKSRREYLRRKRIYYKLFRKAKKIARGRKIIFLTHNCPYRTKLDLVKVNGLKGTHVGSYLERKIIELFQPDIVLCGHVHESYGTERIKKSTIYNVGSSLDGRFKILEI